MTKYKHRSKAALYWFATQGAIITQLKGTVLTFISTSENESTK